VHIQGEEIPAHDPKFTPGIASTYWLAATPGRHTQGGELVAGPGVPVPMTDKYTYSGQAEGHHILVAAVEVVNAAGLCLFGYLSYPFQSVLDQLSAATGDAWDMERIVMTGTRIYTMRHAFNLREGLNPLTRNMPSRIVGEPPLKEGNVKEITVDYRTLAREFLERLGWDTNTTVPSDKSMKELGMQFLSAEMRKIKKV
jgi:aldehyde:ferredoxin oxidoreductase